MGGENENIYDPTQQQINDIGSLLTTREISIDELCKNPQAVRLLLQQQHIQLLNYKETKKALDDIRKINTNLREEKNQLKIEIATLKIKEKTYFLEIPIGMLSGFSINLITNDLSSGLGWLLLVISLILLVFIRWDQIVKDVFSRNGKEDE